mgnify:CR=1 FL=1
MFLMGRINLPYLFEMRSLKLFDSIAGTETLSLCLCKIDVQLLYAIQVIQRLENSGKASTISA